MQALLVSTRNTQACIKVDCQVAMRPACVLVSPMQADPCFMWQKLVITSKVPADLLSADYY